MENNNGGGNMADGNSREYKAKNAWLEMEEAEKIEINKFSDRYANFITENKTEREFVKGAEKILKEEGFKELEKKEGLNMGDKIYSINRQRGLIAAVIGERDLIDGLCLIGSHIDSPRIDLKPNPVFEKGDLTFLDSHYYGGIKKYQWVTIPLAIHGIVVKENGEKVSLNVGENENDPVFYITDLLPHLGKEQMKKKMSKAITGEQLNILIGSKPLAKNDDDSEKIKNGVLKLLEEKYEINGEDFVSADLQIVPAFKARDVGFDRGLLAAYGQDDRVCSYSALEAILDQESPEKTSMVLLTDKEEIGSMGNTGMQSHFFENTVAEMVNKFYDKYNDLILRQVIQNSEALSGDVNAAYDPDFSDVFAKNNSAFLGKGIVLTKYTGARGKAGASEATAEFIGKIRSLFNEKGVIWQIGEIGKVDKGGGGTIAQFLANYNMDVLDAGPALLSMHSPYEVASKVDIYHTYLGYSTFYAQK